MILVTGPKDPIGSEALRLLRERGAEAAGGELEDPAGLRAALDGVDRMLLVSSPGPRLGELEAAAVQAAADAGVRHVVKVSGTAGGLGPAAPSAVDRAHWQVEQEVERSGLEFTLLRPNLFMQSLLGDTASHMARAGVLEAPMGDAPVALVDCRDVAAVAAVALTEDGHTGRVYDVTGPRSLTFSQVADVLSSAAGRNVSYVDREPAAERAAWEQEHLEASWELFRLGGGAAVSPAVREVTGSEPRDLSAFAAEHAQAFRGDGLPAPARAAARIAAVAGGKLRR